IYRDYERTGEEGDLVLYSGGPKFPKITQPPAEYDEEAGERERADPRTFAVEEWGQWMSSSDAFFDREPVQEAFKPWGDRSLTMQTEGRLDVEYFCHGDPAKSHCNFSFNIAHIEWVDGMPHVVVDLVEVWRPRDFPKGKIDFMY